MSGRRRPLSHSETGIWKPRLVAVQYFFRKQIGKGFFEEIFAFEAVKLETHRQTGHELGDVAIKERRPDFKGIQHGTADLP